MLSTTNFSYLCDSVATRSAISLGIPKRYLVIDRLTPVVKQHKLGTLDRLVHRLRMDSKDPLWSDVIDALATNETSFFRDEQPFGALNRKILPRMLEASADNSKVRIWSAACSSGQEPFSLAMLIHEVAPRAIDRFSIHASDVSKTMIKRAESGTFAPLEVARGLSESRQRRYLESCGETWRMREEIRNMITWSQFSLADAWPTMMPFDLILMRNVLVYFEEDAKRQVLKKTKQLLRPGGLLLLGGAEASPLAREYFSPIHVDDVTFYEAKSTL
ncbi:MAG: protein-glutamate O-methyltransferase CheR [Rubripirellula sp.]